MTFVFSIIISTIFIAINCYLYHLAYSEFLDLKSNLESLKNTLHDLEKLQNIRVNNNRRFRHLLCE